MRLWRTLRASGGVPCGALHAAGAAVRLGDLVAGSVLRGHLEALRGRNVLLATREQLASALALIELDGHASRVVLCPPGLEEHLPGVVEGAQVDACVRDALAGSADGLDIPLTVTVAPSPEPIGPIERRATHDTEWVLLTSGTTGAPKLVLHTLAGLSSALMAENAATGAQSSERVVWSTFYDIRRYGGLQIFLRGLRAAALVLSSPGEPVPDFLARARSLGVTHISGTPTHWRRALMSGATALIEPRYVRLSGEIADQAILDNLRTAYPRAVIAHAFATTEAGVAFEVADGKAGFPASFVDRSRGDVELKVIHETLHIRSRGTAIGYLGEAAPALKGADGYIDTGDRVELRDGRYYFAGRRGGVINVGGLKVHPEEVEAAINSHPWVRMSLVKARHSAITGALVVADVVLRESITDPRERPPEAALRGEILETCRRSLAQHKIPAVIRFVPALEVSGSGKLVRPNA